MLENWRRSWRSCAPPLRVGAALIFLGTAALAQGAPATAKPAAATEEIAVTADVEYAKVGESALALDVYRPPGKGPFPGIVAIHGGGWRNGKRNELAMRLFCRYLAQRGYVVFSPSYRLLPEWAFPAQIDDISRAIQFVRHESRRFTLDPARLGVTGMSAGGHLAALVAVIDDRGQKDHEDPVARQSTRVACVVPYFGPMDLQPSAWSRPARRTLQPFLGKNEEDRAQNQVAASPLAHVSADDPPFLLVHGTDDRIVPFDHSKRMAKELREKGVEARLIPIEGAGHGDFLWELPRQMEKGSDPDYWAAMFVFFEKHLGKPKPSRNL